jgi:hypothetical protein
MFAQMKSRNRINTLENHSSTISTKKDKIILYITVTIAIITMFGLLSLLVLRFSSKVKMIEVNGTMCEVHFKKTGITSTGAPLGHNVAVCPQIK